MSEDENANVEQEAQAVVQSQEAETTQTERQETEQERRKRNDAEYNWAEARRAMQERDRKIAELEQQVQKLGKPNVPEEDDGLDKLANDDIITKGHTEKLIDKRAKQYAKEAIKEYIASTVEERVKSKFSDYDEIVTQENIENLKRKKPELALSLAHNPDPYAQAVAVYDALKMVGVGQKLDDTSRLEKERAQKNSQKPVSVNAVTKNSAIGNAHLFENGLTPELKKSLYAEMRQAAKGA